MPLKPLNGSHDCCVFVVALVFGLFSPIREPYGHTHCLWWES